MYTFLKKELSGLSRVHKLVLLSALAMMTVGVSCTASKKSQNKTLPEISINCAESNWDPYTGTFNVQVAYQGTSSPIDTSTLVVTVNNNAVTSALTITAASATGLITGLTNTCDGVTVLATIKDKAGTLASASCNVPALAITYPANYSTIDDPLPAIAVLYTTYTTNTGFSVSMDSSDITGFCTSGTNSAVCQKPMGEYMTPPGTHTVSTHRCFAGGGPCCDKSSAFTFSPPVPSVNILQPSAGYISSTTADISLLFSDTTNKLGLDPNTYTVLVNGSNVTGSFTTAVNSTLPGFPSTPTSLSALGIVPLGTAINNTIQASVTNLFYGVTGTASGSFTVDSIPPSLTIALPVTGSASGSNLPYYIYQDISLPYEADYSDSGSGVNTSSFAINANGTAGSVNTTAISATGSLPVTLPVSSGSGGAGTFVIHAQVSDNAGNTAYANAVATLSLADIGIGSAGVSAGTMFTVPVNVFIDPSHPYGLGSYSINVSFDPSVITFQPQLISGSSSSMASLGVAYSAQFANMPFITDLVSGQENIYSSTTAGGSFPNPVGLFNIANLTFYAAVSGTTDLTITVNYLRDTTGSSLPQSAVQSGTVTVQ